MSGILLSNPVGAFVDKSKGSAKNRAKCAGAHLANNLGYQVAGQGAGLAIGVTGLGIAGRDVITAANATTRADVKNAAGMLGKSKKAIGYVADKISLATKNSKILDGFANKTSGIFDKVVDGAYNLAKKLSTPNNAVLPKGAIFRNKAGKFISSTPQWVNDLKGLSKNKKAGLVFTAVASLAASIGLIAKFTHKNGQIDQKYTDKARLETLENKKYTASKEI